AREARVVLESRANAADAKALPVPAGATALARVKGSNRDRQRRHRLEEPAIDGALRVFRDLAAFGRIKEELRSVEADPLRPDFSHALDFVRDFEVGLEPDADTVARRRGLRPEFRQRSSRRGGRISPAPPPAEDILGRLDQHL